MLEDLRSKTGELLDEGLRSGALTTAEHSWRRQHLAQVDTLEGLETLVEDLMEPQAPASTAVSARNASQVNILSTRTFAVADLGQRSELVTVLGSSRVDLRGLDSDQDLTVEMVTILGDATIEVPLGMKVRVDCTPIMGDCIVDPQLQSRDSRIRITGAVIMGSLRVVAKR